MRRVVLFCAVLAAEGCGSGGGGGGESCRRSDDCVPPVECAVAFCVERRCSFEADSSRCGAGETCDLVRGCVGAAVDAGSDAAVDAGVDAGADACEFVECEGFTECMGGECVPYPGCVTPDMCPEGRVCIARHCVPRGRDVDGDGVPAETDCDETDPRVHPGAREHCNERDDDCDMRVDEDDPAEMCEGMGGICIDGRCGCEAGTFDFDGMPGCECTAAPPLGEGDSCVEAIDLGAVDDTGQMVSVMGNVLPDDRVTWYRFRAIDVADTACDNYHVRAQLRTNPGDTFELTLFRGMCGDPTCMDAGYTDASWATDFRDATGVGECPCEAAPTATPGLNLCSDNTADFYVRVRRRAGRPVGCETYLLEVSNGVYDT
jgi:hypothetical protein